MIKVKTIFLGLYKYKNLLYELIIRDIKIRYRRSVLGLLWTMLNPILLMLVMTIIFSNLFRFDIPHFPIYFFCGNILFSFLTEGTTNALHSITGNASLIKKVYIPKYLFPLSKVFSSVINMFFALLTMLLVMLATGTPFYATILLTPLLMVYMILFTIGMGMILSVIMVFFRDIAHIYNVVTLVWMYLTPIFYPKNLLEEKASWVLKINPMFHFVEYFRYIVLYNQLPTFKQNLTCFLTGLFFLCIGVLLFYKKQDKFILYI